MSDFIDNEGVRPNKHDEHQQLFLGVLLREFTLMLTMLSSTSRTCCRLHVLSTSLIVEIPPLPFICTHYAQMYCKCPKSIGDAYKCYLK